MWEQADVGYLTPKVANAAGPDVVGKRRKFGRTRGVYKTGGPLG